MPDIICWIDPVGTVKDWGPIAVHPPAALMLAGASVGLPLIGVGVHHSVAVPVPVPFVQEEMFVIWMGSAFVLVKLNVIIADPLFWVVLQVIVTWARACGWSSKASTGRRSTLI